jgi:hypothetical protein
LVKYFGFEARKDFRYELTVRNLYSITRSQDALRQLFRVWRDLTGNLSPLPGVFFDTMAPTVRVAPEGEGELTMMRWAFRRRRTSARFLSPMSATRRRPMLKPEWRCGPGDLVLRMDG